MKPLLISLLLLGCSGPAFTEQELYVEGNDTSALGGSSGESSIKGDGSSYDTSESGASSNSGGMAASPSTSDSGGTSALAGRPPMGEGGNGAGSGGAEAGSGGGGSSHEPVSCLAQHQTLACAQVCDSNPYCQGILDCFVRTNSDLTSDCPGFSTTGYTLALQAERNCCNAN